MAQKYPAIPEPVAEIQSVRSTAAATKEGLEILTNQRGSNLLAAVTWQDLINLGLVTPAQIPPRA